MRRVLETEKTFGYYAFTTRPRIVRGLLSEDAPFIDDMEPAEKQLQGLREILSGIRRVAIAVSGGIDSLTLAAVAHDVLGSDALLYHAVSPAVPSEGTERTRTLAQQRGWDLRIIQAGEFNDPQYMANPSNRCFFCKSNLYAAIAAVTDRTILSGANADDLNDYRPGLEAAKDHGVRHPFIEAGIGKSAIRTLARLQGLGDIADLPASPCLSSRIETGIAIDPTVLELVHAAERTLANSIAAEHLRCRVRQAGIVVEIDGPSLSSLDDHARTRALGAVSQIFADGGHSRPVFLAPYRMGSAFLR